MVWDEIRSGSFQFNEEMIESLFGYNPDDKRNANRKNRSNDAGQPQYIQIIDAKKAQNLSILLKALNVTTEEVRDALLEGNELPAELLQTLLRMAPTQEEELKLRLFNGEISQLGPAERFLKVLVDIPFAFKRMESLAFMMTFKEEVTNIKESFVTLEVACDELKKSRLFLKLLEAVLKTGNRMNDGTYRGGAQAFKLDTLLKLADVKGTDGKTTLLHFVVQEIIRSEGLKAMRARKENRSISSMKTDDFVEDSTVDESEHYRTLGLQVVSSISSELENVKKAAVIDGDVLTSTVSKLGQSLLKLKNFLNNEMDDSSEENGFYFALVSFVEHSESQVTWLLEEEQRISGLVRKTADYFHGNAGEEGLRLFSIVRDFLLLLDKICTELKLSFAKQASKSGKESSSAKKASLDQNQSIQDMRQKLFPAIADRRVDTSTSDSDDD
ncbi:Formin-like protein 5 [Bienertia sinuspersici]